jgi:ParB family chromosome partitioning protein
MSKGAEKTADVPTRKNLHADRMEAVADAQEIVRTVTRTVDPNDCIPWEDHDRVNENISYDDLKDLIDDLIAQNEGHNHIPAEVRPIEQRKADGPKYEIIIGLRRWLAIKWLRANNYPQFKYLIKVKGMTDEEAFRYSDLENLQKQDIAPYSRAVKYKKALKKYYHNSQGELAKRLNRSEGWFSQVLRLADLPKDIINAYPNLHDLKVHHAPPILKLLEDSETKPLVIAKAKELAKLHKANAEKGEGPMKGSAVLKALQDASKKPGPEKRGPISTYGNFGEGPLIAVDSKNPDRVKITLALGTGATKTDAINAFKQALADHYD